MSFGNSTPKQAWIASIYKGVVELKVQLGQQVKKGQLIFEVNQDQYEAVKKYNEQTVKFNKLILARGEKLVKNKSISLDDYQQCQRDMKMAKAQLELTKANIALSKYYAPFDGTVTNIICYDGSGLGDNDPEVQITEGSVKIDTAHRVAMVCTRWPGVLDVKVQEGEKVKKGQLLYTINTDDMKAQQIIDEANIEYLSTVVKREKKLYKTNTISLLKYYTAINNLDEAISNLKQVKIQLKQSSGYAPFDGTITRFYNRYTGSGNGAGKPLLDITAAQ